MFYNPPKIISKTPFLLLCKKAGKLGKAGKAAAFTYQETEAQTIM